MHASKLCIAAIFLAQAAAAQEPLFKPTDKAGAAAMRMDVGVLGSFNVMVFSDQLRTNKELTVPLFDGPVHMMRDRLEEVPHGIAWIGHIAEEPESTAIFSAVGESVAGTIIRPNGTMYQLRNVGKGIHALQKIDNAQFPRELEPTPPAEPPVSMDVKPTCTTDPPTLIDLLVVYTPAAREAAGGKEPMEATIGLAAAETNQSYENSGVTQRVRVVHTEEVDYKESGNLKKDRDRLQAPNDRVLDEVPKLRDQYGADAVVMIVERGDGCGISYIMEKVSNRFEPWAYAVVVRGCATGNFSFAHELGHIMSARHDWVVDKTDNKPFHNNHGYFLAKPTSPTIPWRTLMAYNDACEKAGVACIRLPYWANPAVHYPPGDPMGVGEPRPTDDHDALNKTAAVVANFRCRK